jgi:hypothetical protein
MARRLLREAGPLTIDEVLARAPGWGPPRPPDRKGALRNALANDQLVANRGDGRYVFLPVALTGAEMRVPVVAERVPGPLPVGEEVAVFLWPADEDRRGRPAASFALAGGPTVAVTIADRPVGGRLGWDEPTVLVEPEAPFWDWWDARRRGGADELLLRCAEHEAGRFAVGALRRAEL